MTQGFLKIDRQKLDACRMVDSNAFKMFLFMLFDARFARGKTYVNGNEITLERGQLVFGQCVFAARNSLNSSSVQRGMLRLIKMGLVERKKHRKYSIITICSYDEWVSDSSEANVSRMYPECEANTLRRMEECKNKEINSCLPDDPRQKDSPEISGWDCLSVAKLWNNLAGIDGFSKITTQGKAWEARRKKIKTWLKEYPTEQDWREILAVARTKTFQKPDGDMFLPNFDWLFRNQNLVKFHEEYQRNKSVGGNDD